MYDGGTSIIATEKHWNKQPFWEDQDDFCPYNTEHFAPKNGIMEHVRRCRRAYLTKGIQFRKQFPLYSCKYTETHKVPLIEVQWHQQRCPSKDFLNLDFYGDVIPDNPSPTEDKYRFNKVHKEEWERVIQEDASGGSWELQLIQKPDLRPYNPMTRIIRNDIPWLPTGLSKTEKKKVKDFLKTANAGNIPHPEQVDRFIYDLA